MINKKQPVLVSLLDQLLDDAPEQRMEPPLTSAQQLSALHESVRRDLENLLNTRQRSLSWPKHLIELSRSLYAYGIPDVMNNYLEDQHALQQFCQTLASAIQCFEPRFKEVKVLLLQNAEQQKVLRLRIDGLLYAEPVLEPIVLDSVLDPETQTFILAGIT